MFFNRTGPEILEFSKPEIQTPDQAGPTIPTTGPDWTEIQNNKTGPEIETRKNATTGPDRTEI